MEFLKINQLELNPAGYLVSIESKKPVTHVGFVSQQKAAEYIVKLADAIKDKNFTPCKIDDIKAIKQQVFDAINNTNLKKYVEDPTKPVSSVNEELIQYALDFANYHSIKAENEQVNEMMNQFNKIDDVENVGEYFEEGLAKLNNLYTIEDILAAVKINIEKLK